MSGRVNTDALHLVTILMACLLVGGSLTAYDKPSAQMFGLLGGVSLPLVALLYNAAG